jgi:PAS domain S-box-containing protein
MICYFINTQITSRRHIEAAFDELSELSEAIVTETDSGVLVFDAKGRCVTANPSVARMLGVSIQQLRNCELGRSDTWFPFSLWTAMHETLQSGERRQLTVRIGDANREVWSAVSIGQLRRGSSFYLLMVFSDISAYKAAQDKAVAALKRAGTAERNLVNVGEEVQQRIGRELHDDLGQHLAGAAFMSEVLYQKLKAAGYDEKQDAAKITAMMNEAISKTRYLSHGLYPEELREKGFFAMMQKLAAYVDATNQITCEFQCECDCNIDDPEIAIHLFRISQEAVSNAIRHGRARRITLSMAGAPKPRILTIQDDGIGFEDAASLHKGGGLGMRTMQYRADLIGATFKVSGAKQGGTCITVQLAEAT